MVGTPGQEKPVARPTSCGGSGTECHDARHRDMGNSPGAGPTHSAKITAMRVPVRASPSHYGKS